MSNAVEKYRPSKRDVNALNDEESPIDQSAEKSMKREEEPDPSPQVVQFQQELARLKGIYQRNCRRAREYMLHAEQAGHLIDLKRDVLDGTKKDKGELALANDALKTKNNKRRKKKAEPQASLHNATTKLAQNRAQQLAKFKLYNVIIAEDERLKLLNLYEIGDPTNIFQLCLPDSKDSMDMQEALSMLTRAKEAVDWDKFMQRPLAPLLSLSCEACNGVRMIGSNCIDHFLGFRHHKKVLVELGRVAGVSRAAVDFWVREMQPVQQLQPAADSSTFTAVEWPPIDVKKEDEEEEDDDCEE